jgi:hypothetical protein
MEKSSLALPPEWRFLVSSTGDMDSPVCNPADNAVIGEVKISLTFQKSASRKRGCAQYRFRSVLEPRFSPAIGTVSAATVVSADNSSTASPWLCNIKADTFSTSRVFRLMGRFERSVINR